MPEKTVAGRAQSGARLSMDADGEEVAGPDVAQGGEVDGRPSQARRDPMQGAGAEALEDAAMRPADVQCPG